MSYYNKFLFKPKRLEFLPEAQAYFNAMQVQPDNARKILVNNVIHQLKDTGLWNKLGFMYLFAAHDGQAGRVDLTGQISNAVVSTVPTFTADTGFNGWALVTPVTIANIPNFGQNDNHVGYYTPTNSTTNNNDIGANQATNRQFEGGARSAGSGLFNFSNTAGGGLWSSGAVVVPASNGHSLVTRTSSTNVKLYKDGVDVTTTAPGTTTSTALVNVGLVLTGGALNTSNRMMSVVHAGSGLNATEAQDMSDIIDYYLVNL